MPAAPSFPEVVRRALESRLGDVFTTLPGRIQTYDTATQTADVALVVRRPLPTGEESDPVYEEVPVLPNVPILFPRGSGGAYAITWPLQAGDHVLVIFTTWSFASWRRTGETSDPGDLRPHHPGNAVAYPAMAPNDQALSQAAIPALVIEGTEIRIGKNAAQFIAMANKVLTELTKIKNMFTSWTPVPNDGGAALKALSNSLSFSSVAATKGKVE